MLVEDVWQAACLFAHGTIAVKTGMVDRGVAWGCEISDLTCENAHAPGSDVSRDACFALRAGDCGEAMEKGRRSGSTASSRQMEQARHWRKKRRARAGDAGGLDGRSSGGAVQEKRAISAAAVANHTCGLFPLAAQCR